MKRVSRYLALLLAIAMLLSLSGFAEMPAEPQDGFGEAGEAGDIMEIGGAVDPESSESGDVDLSDIDGAPTEPGVGGETPLDENGNPISVDGPRHRRRGDPGRGRPARHRRRGDPGRGRPARHRRR